MPTKPDEPDLMPVEGFVPLMAWRVAISESDGLLALVLVDDQDRHSTFYFPPSVAEEMSERLAVNAHALRTSLGLNKPPAD